MLKSRLGLLLWGFILGPIVELYLRRGVMISEGSLFMPFINRPIPRFILILSVLFFDILSGRLQKPANQYERDDVDSIINCLKEKGCAKRDNSKDWDSAASAVRTI